MKRMEEAFLCIEYNLRFIWETVLKPICVVVHILKLLAVKALYFYHLPYISPISVFKITLHLSLYF